MSLTREPIFHDRQSVEITGPLTTTSATFVDVPGLSITTKDLSQETKYLFIVTVEVSHNANNSSISLRVTVDGSPSTGKAVSFGPNSMNTPQTVTFIGSGIVAANSVLQAQWSTPSGTATLNLAQVVIDGIPSSRII